MRGFRDFGHLDFEGEVQVQVLTAQRFGRQFVERRDDAIRADNSDSHIDVCDVVAINGCLRVRDEGRGEMRCSMSIDPSKVMQDPETVPVRRLGHEGLNGCQCLLQIRRQRAEPSTCCIPPHFLVETDRPLQPVRVGGRVLVRLQHSDGIEAVVESSAELVQELTEDER